jgi:hypothetical protein
MWEKYFLPRFRLRALPPRLPILAMCAVEKEHFRFGLGALRVVMAV